MTIRNVFVYGVILLLSSLAFAAPYSGQVFDLAQPDGTTVQVKVYGDEYYQNVESLDGYTLIRNPQNAWIEYAEKNDDDSDFVATGVAYQDRLKTDPNHPVFKAFAQQRFARMKDKAKTMIRDNAPALKKQLRLRRDVVLEKVRKEMKDRDPVFYSKMFGPSDSTSGIQPAGEPVAPAPLSGSVIGLTILIDFSDQVATVSQAEIMNYCNQPGYTGYGNDGSVRDYFYDVSNGKLEYTNYVTTYYRAQHPKSYYEGDCSSWGKTGELIGEALQWLDSTGFDFRTVTRSGTQIKALNFFYAGNPSCGWSKGLWPHKGWYSSFTSNEGVTTGNYQMSNIGSGPLIYVFCHENGHMICGYPDLYDYGGESSGVGNFCLMAGRPNDKKPMPPCGYLRSVTGWETVIDIYSDPAGTLHTHTANTNLSYRYVNPANSKEFFMVESRLKTGRSSMIPAEGLIIWHVDENGSNDYEQMTPTQHYKVSVEQADGAFHLEHDTNSGDGNDSFRAGYKDMFDDTTSPNAHWWDGSSSGLKITQISAVSSQMNFTVGDTMLAGYWKFNGNGNDSGPAGKNMIGYNFSPSCFSTDTWNGGLVNLDRCVVFDGIDDYAQVASVANGAATLSAAFWLRCDNPSDMVLLDKFPVGSGGAGWRISLDSAGRLHFAIGSQTAYTVLTTAQPVAVSGLWRHIACTFDAGTAIIYVNGQQVAEASEIPQTPASSAILTIGKSGEVAFGQSFEGRMDELYIYTMRLTNSAIQALPGLMFQERAGLIGYWNFDELSGTVAADSGPLANNGILNGGFSFTSNSIVGQAKKALSFDGTADYVKVGNDSLNFPGPAFSVCLWVYPTAVKKWARFIDLGSGAPLDNIILTRYDTTNDLAFQTYSGSTSGNYVRAANAIELNKWQFFAATIDSAGNVKLYKNGTLIQSGTSAVLRQLPRINNYFGRSNWATDEYYQGAMDEVRLFNYALTAQQVQDLKNGIWAIKPSPADHHPAVSAQATLSWTAAAETSFYAVYLGTNSAAVSAATPASPEFQGCRYEAQFTPDNLNPNTVYYWRVDSFLERDSLFTGPVWTFTTSGSVTRETWTGITGSNVTNLTSSTKYPNNPDLYEYLQTFESPVSYGENYGQRLQALLTPQTSGSYTFWIACDDSSELWLSTNAAPANAVRIASVSAYTSSRQWTKYSSQQSAVKSLVAGQSYYIMALHKEATGGDNLAVAWQGPDCPTRSVIQGRYLMPYISKPAPKFSSGTITKNAARETQNYTTNISTDILNGGSFTFSKIAGPEWMSMSANGSVSSTPARGDKGQNSFMVQAKDAFGRIDQATLQISVGAAYDGSLGLPDMIQLANNWLFAGTGSPSDLDSSNSVDMQDFAILCRQWEKNIIDGLMCWWKMDDAVLTTLRDSYGNYDAIIINRSSDRSVLGKAGNALSFNGVSGYAKVNGFKGIAGTASRTCMAWIKMPVPTYNMAVMSWGNSVAAGQGWLFGIFSTGQAGIYAGGPSIRTNNSVTDNKWHHVAAVLDSDGTPELADIKLYIDGVLQTTVISGSASINTSSDQDVMFGAFMASGLPTAFYNGLIDDLKLFNRALNGQEIIQEVHSDLEALWAFDELSGLTAADSAKTHTGTLINMPANPWAAGHKNNALLFDGVNDYIAVTGWKGILGTQSRTCAAWIKAGSLTQNSVVLNWGPVASGQQWIFGLFGTGEFTIYAGGPYIKTTMMVNDNQWHHIAAAMANDGSPDCSEIKLYIDGQLQTTSSNPGAVNTTQAGDVAIGAYLNGIQPSGFFPGMIDEVMIYNIALNPQQILEIFN